MLVVTSSNLRHAVGPIYFSSQAFDSTLLLNRRKTREDDSYMSVPGPHVLACGEDNLKADFPELVRKLRGKILELTN